MKENTTAPKLLKHIFICQQCTNYAQAENQPYAVELREMIRKEIEKNYERFEVKISKSGCLGQCKEGINAVCYPEGKWFKCLSKDTVEDFVEYIKSST